MHDVPCEGLPAFVRVIRILCLQFQKTETFYLGMIWVLCFVIGTFCTMDQRWYKACTLNIWLPDQLLCPSLQSILNILFHTIQKYWQQNSDNFKSKQDVWRTMVIKGVYQYKWATYYSCRYCINAMKQYTCIAKFCVILYCNMA